MLAPDAEALGPLSLELPPPSDGVAGAAVEVPAVVAAAELPVEPPLRKSVAYQPEPLSWKPAAVTCLENVSAPQAGQVLRVGSDSFCSTSLA
ncbi:MAG: hypothetical protein RLZZ524_1549 [Pseudomonadota bacterium]